MWVLLSGICLGLGFGAKLFPIVLTPLFIVVFAKQRLAAAFCFISRAGHCDDQLACGFIIAA